MQRTLTHLYLVSLLLVVPSLAEAQEEAGGEESVDSSQRGIDAYYGKLKITGEASDEPAETEFGLERMYGGVSGQAGLQGGRARGPRRDAPEVHTVKKGDTLWDLSEEYYGNPWAWPQVWSLNPQIENPHWIYPGDQLRTKPEKGSTRHQIAEDNSAGGGGMVGRARLVPEGTVFIRDHGYIGDPEEDVWGEVVGSSEDTMLLSEGQTIYLLMREGVDLRIGQRLTVFHAFADAPRVPGARRPPGEMVKIFGTVRVDAWDPETRVVKGSLIESLDAIERGFSVGPVGRRFDVVSPEPASTDVEAHVIGGLPPCTHCGKDQVVFIDKGSEDGLVPGNRLRIVRRGDAWRRGLETTSVHARLRAEMGSPEVAEAEATPIRGDDDDYPDEVVGELLVLRTEDYSAVCLVIGSSQALQIGDRAVAVEGY